MDTEKNNDLALTPSPRKMKKPETSTYHANEAKGEHFEDEQPEDEESEEKSPRRNRPHVRENETFPLYNKMQCPID